MMIVPFRMINFSASCIIIIIIIGSRFGAEVLCVFSPIKIKSFDATIYGMTQPYIYMVHLSQTIVHSIRFELTCKIKVCKCLRDIACARAMSIIRGSIAPIYENEHYRFIFFPLLFDASLSRGSASA
jgi:hypothetical protein